VHARVGGLDAADAACCLCTCARVRARAFLPVSQVGSRSIWFAHAKEAFEKGGIPPPSSSSSSNQILEMEE